MTRPIDADALYMELVKMKDFGELTAKKAIRVVKNAPTIDAEPVRHGKWIFQRNYTWACSECGTNPTEGMGYVQCKEELFEYCPNCGAYMRGEK